jgi:hypothetical protein
MMQLTLTPTFSIYIDDLHIIKKRNNLLDKS